jgi:hypothetical protein
VGWCGDERRLRVRGREERARQRAQDQLAPSLLLPGETVVASVPASGGVNPLLLNIPVLLAMWISISALEGDLSVAAVIVLGVGFLLAQALLRPRCLVLTEQRLLTCSVTVFGSLRSVLRADPTGAVRLGAVRGWILVGSVRIDYPDARARVWLSPVWFGLMTRRFISTMPPPSAPSPAPPRSDR